MNAVDCKPFVGLASHFDLYISNTSDAIDLGPSTKNEMAATAIGRLTLFPIQDIAYECGSLQIGEPLVGFTSHFDIVSYQ